MNGASFEEIKQEIRDAIQMDYIEPADIPAIELYMDQVTTFMDKHLSNNKRSPEDKILTKTMINNYTKNHPMIEKYFHASEQDSVNLTSIYSTVVELAQHQYQLDKQGIFESYEIVNKKLREEHPETPVDENMAYLQDFTFVALLSYDIYLKTQLVEKIIDQLEPPQTEESAAGETKSGKESKKKA